MHKHSNNIQFADDATFHNTGNNIKLLFNQVNKHLEELAEWCRANKLSLNTKKSNYMIFGGKQHDPNIEGQYICIGGETVHVHHIYSNCFIYYN